MKSFFLSRSTIVSFKKVFLIIFEIILPRRSN